MTSQVPRNPSVVMNTFMGGTTRVTLSDISKCGYFGASGTGKGHTVRQYFNRALLLVRTGVLVGDKDIAEIRDRLSNIKSATRTAGLTSSDSGGAEGAGGDVGRRNITLAANGSLTGRVDKTMRKSIGAGDSSAASNTAGVASPTAAASRAAIDKAKQVLLDTPGRDGRTLGAIIEGHRKKMAEAKRDDSDDELIIKSDGFKPDPHREAVIEDVRNRTRPQKGESPLSAEAKKEVWKDFITWM